MSTEKCYACGKRLSSNPYVVLAPDGKGAHVGSECYASIKQAGPNGFLTKRGVLKIYEQPSTGLQWGERHKEAREREGN